MKHRILIIEDEKSDYEAITRSFEEGAHDLVWTQTAHEGLRRANDEHFDLLLLDASLSDMDLSTVLERFNVLHPFLPVIIFTESSSVLRAATC